MVQEATLWSCRHDEWWFRLWFYFFSLFPLVLLRTCVRMASGWNVGLGAITFVTGLLPFLVTKILLHSHCQRFKWCLTNRWRCFQSYCCCSTLTCPLEMGISSSETTAIALLTHVQSKKWDLFSLMSACLLCIQDKLWSDECFKNRVSVSHQTVCWLYGLLCRLCSFNNMVLI